MKRRIATPELEQLASTAATEILKLVAQYNDQRLSIATKDLRFVLIMVEDEDDSILTSIASDILDVDAIMEVLAHCIAVQKPDSPSETETFVSTATLEQHLDG
jgi:hypothetical protein